MPDLFAPSNVASEQYAHALSALYSQRFRINDPDWALLQDPEVYDKAERDAIVAHAMRHRRHLVAGRDWRIVPASESDVDRKAAKIVEAILKKLKRFSSARFNLANGIFRGSAFGFIRGARQQLSVDGVGRREWWVPSRVVDVHKFRVSKRYDHEIDDFRWFFWSVERAEWERITNPEWFVKHVYDDTEESLGYGHGLLESIYYYLYAKARVLEDALQGSERWSQGIATVGIDGLREASSGKPNTAIVRAWLDVWAKARSRNMIPYDKLDELKVLTGGAEGHQIAVELLAYLDSGLRTLILGSNLPTSATSGGSYALAEIQENSTEALVQYDRELLGETLTDDVIGLVWRLNRSALAAVGCGEAEPPHLQIAQEKKEDPQQNATTLDVALKRVPIVRQEYYEKIGCTPPRPGDDVIQPTPDPVAPAAPEEGALLRAGGDREVRFLAAVETRIAEAFARAAPRRIEAGEDDVTRDQMRAELAQFEARIFAALRAPAPAGPPAAPPPMQFVLQGAQMLVPDNAVFRLEATSELADRAAAAAGVVAKSVEQLAEAVAKKEIPVAKPDTIVLKSPDVHVKAVAGDVKIGKLEVGVVAQVQMPERTTQELRLVEKDGEVVGTMGPAS